MRALVGENSKNKETKLELYEKGYIMIYNISLFKYPIKINLKYSLLYSIDNHRINKDGNEHKIVPNT
ncbi:hypothetical protein D7D25_02395 [Proteiniphilum sp. X52]|nr:hypothetical protein D7D25_02395 [Proteiniphilum sp. X52]